MQNNAQKSIEKLNQILIKRCFKNKSRNCFKFKTILKTQIKNSFENKSKDVSKTNQANV
jgi:hypothetical protein